MEKYIIFIVIAFLVAMAWFVREIVRGIQNVKFTRYLRKLSDEQLSDLYSERWLKLNSDVLNNRKQLVQHVAIIRELMRRNLYTGRVVN